MKNTNHKSNLETPAIFAPRARYEKYTSRLTGLMEMEESAFRSVTDVVMSMSLKLRRVSFARIEIGLLLDWTALVLELSLCRRRFVIFLSQVIPARLL